MQAGSSPVSERHHGEGNGSPLQSSCLENPVDKGAWWATVHEITKRWTWVTELHPVGLRATLLQSGLILTNDICSDPASKQGHILRWGLNMVALMVKNLPAVWGPQVLSLGWEDPLEERMATHSSILAWRIPWAEEPGGLESMGSQRVGHDWANNTFPFCEFRVMQFSL